MKTISELSVSLTDPGSNTAGTALSYSIEVAQLATKIINFDQETTLQCVPQGVTLVLPGAAAVDLTANAESIRLAPGMALVVDAKSLLTVRRCDAVKALEQPPPPLYVIEFHALMDGAFPINEFLGLPILLGSEAAQTVERIFEQLTFGGTAMPRLPGGVDITRHFTAMHLVATLLSSADADGVMQRKPVSDQRVPKLRQFLLENMSRSVNISEMAHHMGMSRTAFFRWARTALGCPPLKYLRIMRIEQCQQWLSQNADSLDEIASHAGFSSCSHLGREFKKHVGMTPAKYRTWIRSSDRANFCARAAEQDYSRGRFDEALAACERG